MTRSSITAGPLNPARHLFAVSKLAGLVLLQSYRTHEGRSWVAVLPTNVYGPGDNFDPERAHVVPSMIRRLDEAHRQGHESVKLWGTGTARRDLLHVDDLASACSVILRQYDGDEPMNVGTGSDVSIAELAQIVAREVGYNGRIQWDTTRPDGAVQRLLDIQPLRSLGWSPSIGLCEGVRQAVRDFRRSGGG